MVYRDADGNVVSLSELCRRDPEWAANRIRALTTQATEPQEWSPSKKRVEAYRAAKTRLDRVAALNHSLQDFIEDTDPPNRRALTSLLTDYICAVEGIGEPGATECRSVAGSDIETMIRALTGEIDHDYQGGCPVQGATDARDPDCPVCQAMVRAARAAECQSDADDDDTDCGSVDDGCEG